MNGPLRLTILRLAFWAAVLFAFAMAVVPQPPQLPGGPSDKFQHVAAFAGITALGFFAYPRTKALKLAIGLSLFGALIEVVQAIPALQRDSDILDWVADNAAIAVVLFALRWFPARWKGSPGKG